MDIKSKIREKLNEAKKIPPMKSLPLVLLKNPAGTYSFAGKVPRDLMYKMKDGSPMTDQMVNDIRSFGPGLFKNRVSNCSWKTKEEALKAAQDLGVKVDQISEGLDESDVSSAAKTWGMTHIAFNHWKDRNGIVWNWNKEFKKFERNHEKTQELNHVKYNKQPNKSLKRKLIGVLDDYVNVNVPFKNIESKIDQVVDKFNGEETLVSGSKEFKEYIKNIYKGWSSFDKFWKEEVNPILKDMRDEILKIKVEPKKK